MGLGAAASTIATVLGVVVSTVVLMVVGELVPKNWAISRPLAVAKVVATPQRGFTAVFGPFIEHLNNTANRFVRRLGLEPAEELAHARGPEELVALARHSAAQGTLEKDSAELFVRTLHLGELLAENVMTPRVGVKALEAHASAADAVALTRVLRPVIFGINAVANTLLRLLKVEPKDEVAAVFTDDELARLVADSSQAGLLDPADGERLRDALELGTRPVGEVLVPLARMRTVDHRVTPAQLEKAATGAGYSRMPVVGSDGTIMGYLHIKDAIGVPERHSPFPRAALHPVIRVQIDTPLDDALTAMRAAGTHLAAVTGDKGTVIGFVTMEDVLSELVGPTTA